MNRMRRYAIPLILVLSAAASAAPTPGYDKDTALGISQDAIGNTLGHYEFTDPLNRKVDLRDNAGKPLLISMIFTSCHHVCPMTTKNLGEAVRAARETLGNDSFDVVTVGFDTLRDTPDAMRAFARAQGIDVEGWKFLSGSQETIEALSSDLGFQYFTSPRGFDHINQVTVIDRESVVYRQIYGITFDLPWLVEPLKELVFNRPTSQGHMIASLVDRVRLFCTVYNPATGRYEIDNSLFIQIAIGFLVVLAGFAYLWRGFHPKRHL
jgi:protein SCO1/2